jgi:molybdenum cofactor synthesis domain-containing protein
MNRPDVRRLIKRTNPLEAVKLLPAGLPENYVSEESLPLEACVGRVLAKDVFSNLNIPDHEKTFVDGYAINPVETKTASMTKPVRFKIIGNLFPSDYPTAAEIRRGEAYYVACGAPLPKGATAAVKVEETRMRENAIEVIREIDIGEGIIPAGDDVKNGDLLIKKGNVLRPQDIGLLASLELTYADVIKKPTISIISGGDELLKQYRRDPTKTVNNYALVVAGLASELGADPKLCGIMPDSLDEVKETIKGALNSSDIVVTIGGSSVGIKDFVPDAVNALGKPGVIVQGVAMRPGAISGFGLVNGKPVVMLPGHIGSCIAGFYLFVVPLIGAYTGQRVNAILPRVTALMGETVETSSQFRFLLVYINQLDGKFEARSTEGGSSALTTIVKSNGYALIPPHTKLSKGEEITIFLFNKLELNQFSP